MKIRKRFSFFTIFLTNIAIFRFEKKIIYDKIIAREKIIKTRGEEMSPYNIDDSRTIENILYEFLKQHKSHLPIENHFELLDYLEHEDVTSYFTSSFLAQVYEEAGLMKPECSIYYHMKQIIMQNFNIGSDFIEIGSGIFPVLGHSIRKEQIKIGAGNVTVYDSKVWSEYSTTAVLKQENFTLDTKVNLNSILVGIFPCEAMNMMLEKSLNEELECCIALCGCNHSGIKFLPPREYHERLINYLSKNLPHGKKLQLYQFPKECFNDNSNGFPILVIKDTKAQKVKKY